MNIRSTSQHTVVGLLATLFILVPVYAQEGQLDSIRRDVASIPRTDSSGDSETTPQSTACASTGDSRSRRRRHDYNEGGSSSGWGSFLSDMGPDSLLGLTLLGAAAVTSPWTVPYSVFDEGSATPGYFDRYPYKHEEVGGYMFTEDWKARPRFFSGRYRMDYADEFDGLHRVAGRFLFETTTRLGIDAETEWYEEQLDRSRTDGARADHLWLGDANITFRFAQGPRAQWRTGLGFNWLDGDSQTDFGFNFTYGFDLFPKKPWVLSSTLNWGTLGDAELFRYRTSVGVIINRIETYVGYEYLDIDHNHVNMFLTGVRVWF